MLILGEGALSFQPTTNVSMDVVVRQSESYYLFLCDQIAKLGVSVVVCEQSLVGFQEMLRARRITLFTGFSKSDVLFLARCCGVTVVPSVSYVGVLDPRAVVARVPRVRVCSHGKRRYIVFDLAQRGTNTNGV